MSFSKIKSDSYCVGERHRSSTKNIYGDITSKGIKVLIDNCSLGKRRKSMMLVIIQYKLKDFEAF